jgi:hypothetical protein
MLECENSFLQYSKLQNEIYTFVLILRRCGVRTPFHLWPLGEGSQQKEDVPL